MKYQAVDPDTIHKLVHAFYGKVRSDSLIGPIFDDVIGDNWDRHLQTMVLFWSSVMLTSGAYKGTPLAKHVALKNVEPFHFDRWLMLFRATAYDLFEPQPAQAFILRAERIAESFKLAMFRQPDAIRVVNAPIAP